MWKLIFYFCVNYRLNCLKYLRRWISGRTMDWSYISLTHFCSCTLINKKVYNNGIDIIFFKWTAVLKCQIFHLFLLNCTLKVSSVNNNDKINLLVVLLFLFRLLTFLKNKFEYLQESGKQRLFVRNIWFII